MQDISIEERKITPEEYLELRSHTNWEKVEPEMVTPAMLNSLYSVVIRQGEQPVAIGRIIGDGGLYYYLQDIIVHRDFRGQGLARVIMEKLEGYLNAHASQNAFIGLMAAEGVQKLYEKYGYSKRQRNAPGMYKLWNRK